MTKTLADHWPEYAAEAACLGLFMLSAAVFATLLQHPASPLTPLVGATLVRRAFMGCAMGLTSAAIVCSPLGRRSGAHMNPAITFSFLRLGRIAGPDAAAYVLAQFAGGAVGIALATALLAGLPADPSVNYVATVPGPAGAAAAFAAEAAISFGMMLTVLAVSNTRGVARFTGVAAGMLAAAYIAFESPVSGMSMNPARTLGPALFSHTTSALWIYFTAPPLGMLLAAELFVRVRGLARVRCAKLHHTGDVRCIFRCGFGHGDPDSGAREGGGASALGAGEYRTQETRAAV